jgi:hypothetical protein
MRQKRRIEFDEAWFDYTKDDAPEGTTGLAART